MRLTAYPPVYQPSWPRAPHWHAPAMELDVVYPVPGPYARRKDASVQGSLSYAPFMAGGLYGADPAPASAPAAVVVPPAPVKEKKEKAVKVQLKNLFKKDESGTSKAEQIAQRAFALAKPPPPPPPPAPVVVQAPAPSAMSGAAPLILTGVAAFAVGLGIGYAVGTRR